MTADRRIRESQNLGNNVPHGGRNGKVKFTKKLNKKRPNKYPPDPATRGVGSRGLSEKSFSNVRKTRLPPDPRGACPRRPPKHWALDSHDQTYRNESPGWPAAHSSMANVSVRNFSTPRSFIALHL